jgi:hypothetical protein
MRGMRGGTLAVLPAIALLIGAGPAWATIAAKPETPAARGTAAWGTDGRVEAMVRIGDVVYMGGSFNHAVRTDGLTAPRANLMAVNVLTGYLRPWRPSVDGIVFAMATDGSTIFIGGDFTTVNSGQPRSNFVAIGPRGGVRNWHLDTTNQVRALTYSGTTLFLGGQFGFVEGQRRTRLAAADLSVAPPTGGTPPLLDWTPRTDKSVRSILVMQNGNVLIGGVWEEIREQGAPTWDDTKPFIQALTPPGPGGGLFARWNEHTVDFVWKLAMMPDGRIIVGRGGRKGGTVALYTETGTNVWHIFANGDVQAVGYADGRVIAGGHWAYINGGPGGRTHLPRLVSINPVTGKLDMTWQPWPDSTKGVWSVLATPDRLMVGGDFTRMDHGNIVANHYAQFPITAGEDAVPASHLPPGGESGSAVTG